VSTPAICCCSRCWRLLPLSLRDPGPTWSLGLGLGAVTHLVVEQLVFHRSRRPRRARAAPADDLLRLIPPAPLSKAAAAPCWPKRPSRVSIGSRGTAAPSCCDCAATKSMAEPPTPTSVRPIEPEHAVRRSGPSSSTMSERCGSATMWLQCGSINGDASCLYALPWSQLEGIIMLPIIAHN